MIGWRVLFDERICGRHSYTGVERFLPERPGVERGGDLFEHVGQMQFAGGGVLVQVLQQLKNDTIKS